MHLECVAGSADAGDAELEATDVENVEGDVVTLAGFSKKVGGGDFAVRQDQWAGGRAVDAELVFLCADGEAGGVALDEEGGELLRPDAGSTTLAKTVKRSAKPQLVIHIFSPLRM